ncbi:efflux RND transporter periplasmic adaptor subunit [Frigidibacter sp. RF13]|uniref:efflux RND transporter periplasmic adaptor subunit n=1 Tax=Frigidibacter sp. RF13 TaxID=2997340 RepID=UPI002272140B|nr:efflux RND transporter periplasmic adaptor subunit [Frigidibacter sp. RF13]MCY1126497.1 efflux RND transporter periplasmic adaptor subunit [Frigidibacter sp. RF13]
MNGRAVLFLLLAVASVTARPACAQEEPLAVEIVDIEPGTQTRVYALTGELRARDSIDAAFPLAGRIVAVLVEEGQSVSAGTPLARMDAVQQKQALRAAEAGLETATADERQARADLTRAEALLDRGATTRADRDAAADRLQIAAGALAQATADLDRAKKALDDTELVAPQDAIVTRRMAEAGQIVGAAQPVLELALSTGVQAVFQVPEVLLTQEARPSTIRISRLSDPSTEFAGTIGEISPLVDAATGTVEVNIDIPDPPPGLIYGEAVRGTSTTEEPGTLVVPYTALAATGAGPAVWRVDPATGAVSLAPIEVGRYETGWIVVAGGLQPGDRIVGRGAQLLFPGRLVRAAEGGQ